MERHAQLGMHTEEAAAVDCMHIMDSCVYASADCIGAFSGSGRTVPRGPDGHSR